ncbi:unnamed protein product [Urochloa humidicola]
MAEGVVGVLIGKLGAALASEAATYGASLFCKEVSAIKRLFGEIRKAEGELQSMKAYLHGLDKFKDTDETIGLFVERIRKLSFRIEDSVDEFTYKLEDNKHGVFPARMRKRIKQVKVWRRLAQDLRDINSDLEDAARQRDRYPIPVMETYARDHHDRSNNQTTCFAWEEDLVGIEDNADKLTRWLVGDLEERNYRISTVWGMGGVGKTTLVHHVFKIVKDKFDKAAWVTVSKTYQVSDLLKKIAREFGTSVDESNKETRSLAEVIHKHLQGQSYIMVLDDVWERGVWMDIMNIFSTNGIKRFVLTSRNSEVASLATENCIVELKPLGENLSSKLFCNVAFRNSDNKMCPFELQNLAIKFLQKCEGLPIAIACIGRLLACRSPTYPVWEKVYNELELHSTKNGIPGVDTVILVSLEDLPYELKNCLLHCALTPEDFGIKRRRAVRLWITAGFIKEKENKTLEEVAEGYLNELISRSLLQVVKKNEFGRVKCCRMHDVVRHVALNKAESECFGKVYEGSSASSIGGTRRLSIQSTSIAMLSQSGATHLRAIYAFTDYVDIELLKPILASSGLLSTLDLQGTKIKILPNEVFNLFNLRFLGLRNTEIEILPEAVGRLQKLEVLDLLFTALLSLPKGIANLKKLRYLYAGVRSTVGPYVSLCGVKVPRGIQNLTRLHALQKIIASSETICDVAALTELRTFSVSEVATEHSLNLCTAIRNMSSLVHLAIFASNKNEVLPWEALRLPETLSKLKLRGQLEKKGMPQLLSWWSHLNNLTRLTLSLSKLDEDSFSSLFVLSGLRLLRLVEAYDGKKLCFPALSFPRLRAMVIYNAPHLNQVEIEEGALADLVELEFSDCPELKRLPHGVEFLRALDDLRLHDTADDLMEMLCLECEAATECKQELTKIRHIRNVIVSSTLKKFRARIDVSKGEIYIH